MFATFRRAWRRKAMARHLHRELRELTDLQVAELWVEVSAEHERRLGARAERRPEARASGAEAEPAPAEAEEEPAPEEQRVFFQCRVWSSRFGRRWHSCRSCRHIARSEQVTETTISGYIEPEEVFLSSWFTDQRKEPCGTCTPCIRGMVFSQNPRLKDDPRILIRRRSNVRWVAAGGEMPNTWIAIYPDEDGGSQ